MDHKVSKDMISSGMIPSGEKTQADLGRTQYGSAPSPSKLMDAYKSMYGNKEEVINEKVGGKGMGMTPAPKPGGITPAKRVEKSNLPKPQDPATSKPQKDFIKARMSDSPSPKTEPPKTDSRMDQVKKLGFAKSYRQIGPKSETEDMQDRLTDRKIERKVDKDMKRDRLKKIMADNESVDLLAAYRSIYEHHKKDADGNTIPHEDEEVNEGKIPAGLQAYLDKKKGKKEDKKDDKEMKESVEEKVIKIKKDLGESADLFDIISTYFIEEGYDKKDVYAAMSSIDLSEEVQDLHEIVPAVMAGIKAVGGLMAKKGIGGALKTVGAKVGSKIGGSAGRKLGYKAGSVIAKNPMASYYVAKDLMPGGGGGGNQQPMMSKRTSSISASADLFDIVKGQLIDEGLSEEEIKDIMLTLTPDEIMEELSDNIKRIDAANKAKFEGSASEKVKAAAKRQYKAGSPGAEPYTTADKKTIIGANKKPVERTGGRTDGTAGSYVEKPKM